MYGQGAHRGYGYFVLVGADLGVDLADADQVVLRLVE